MTITPVDQATPFQDINAVLQAILQGIGDILGGNLVGLYLFGSLTYGDFNPASSDIDLVALLTRAATSDQLASLKELHVQVGRTYPKWARRLECSYTPRTMLPNMLPPELPRPYVGEGIFYPEAQYGNEWIINLYLLRQHGIPLLGPDFDTLSDPIPMVEVQKACIRDLFREWEPKLDDPDWLANSHYQSYLVLNLCRILYTVMTAATASKTGSARWVKAEYPAWRDLIETAERWQYGAAMQRQDATLAFLRFVIDQIKTTTLYVQLS